MPEQTVPDQTVKVSFTAPSTFVFDPPAVTLTSAGKIVMHQEPTTADWTFVSVNELPAQFTSSVTGNGNGITVNDGHTSDGSWHYTVTVHDASGDHTSDVQVAARTTTDTTASPMTSLPMITNQ